MPRWKNISPRQPIESHYKGRENHRGRNGLAMQTEVREKRPGAMESPQILETEKDSKTASLPHPTTIFEPQDTHFWTSGFHKWSIINMINFKPLLVRAAVILMNGIDIILRSQTDLCKFKPEKKIPIWRGEVGTKSHLWVSGYWQLMASEKKGNQFSLRMSPRPGRSTILQGMIPQPTVFWQHRFNSVFFFMDMKLVG